jgi:hypothetical protein
MQKAKETSLLIALSGTFSYPAFITFDPRIIDYYLKVAIFQQDKEVNDAGRKYGILADFPICAEWNGTRKTVSSARRCHKLNSTSLVP